MPVPAASCGKDLKHFLLFKAGREKEKIGLHGSNYEVTLGILWSQT